MKCTCTILFEDPFWVAVFDRKDDDQYTAARFVFGAEPSDAELHAFALNRYTVIQFSLPQMTARETSQQASFKRRLREARKEMSKPAGATRAQQALQAELERRKIVRREVSKREREVEEQTRFELRKQKKKEKHRGH